MPQRSRSADLFPTDKEVRPDQMMGRTEDVTEFVRQLGNGLNLVVAGPRRTGKTSTCLASIAELRANGYYVVEADLFRLTNAAAFAEALVVSATANRSPLYRVVLQAKNAGRQALRAAQLTVKTRAMQELGEELEIAFAPNIATKEPSRYLLYAFELCQRIAVADKRQVILFIDELQEIAAAHQRFGDPDIITEMMSSVLKKSDRVTCLFAGSVEHLLTDLFTNERRGLYKFGQMTSLSPIPKEAWREGIEERLAQDKCKITPEAFQLLITNCEGHPRAMMLAMQQAHDGAVAEQTRVIDAALIEYGWQRALGIDSQTNAETVNRIKELGSMAFLAAAAVSVGDSPYKQMKAQQARRSLDALVNAGIIEEPARGKWRITDPLLRNYLAMP